MIDEAGACFTNGQYTGSILALATGVEHGLRELLRKPKGSNLNKLIKQAVDARFVNDAQADVLRALTNYRNQMTHSDIDNLAAGTTLWRQIANLTKNRVKSASAWKKIIPDSQDQREIASDLAAKRRVGDILVEVTEVVHYIFGRQSAIDVILEPEQVAMSAVSSRGRVTMKQ